MTELKARESKHNETKIRKEIEQLFFKRIKTSIENMDNLEEERITKEKPFAKSTWYSINYFPKPIENGGLGSRQSKHNKKYDKATCVNNVHGGRKKTRKPKGKKLSEGSTIKDIRNIFRLKKENKVECSDTE